MRSNNDAPLIPQSSGQASAAPASALPAALTHSDVTRCDFNRLLSKAINHELRPLHDRVIVKRLEEERQSAGGIVIPDTAANCNSAGEHDAIGPVDANGISIPIAGDGAGP